MLQTVHAVRMLRVVAGVAATSLLLWSVGFPALFRSVEAAAITNASDTLSDSDLGVASNHTVQFTAPNGLVSGETIVLTFPTAVNEFVFPINGFDFNDIDVLDDGVSVTLGSSASGDTWGVATTSSTITLTTSTSSGSVTVASSSVLVIRIGTNATVGATGNSQITNPTVTDSYEITIATGIDSGSVMVAIIDNVVVTASVQTNFSFSIGAVNAGLTVNGTTTTATSTQTTIPFGTLQTGVITTLAQDLTISTNADNGFAVTLYEDGPLQSSTGADIDEFSDDTDVDTPAPWAPPGQDPSDENTWGHWGVTSEDGFGSNQWIAASTTPRTVFSHNDVVNASTTRVGFQAQITGLQEAGDDYTTTITYIATPVF